MTDTHILEIETGKMQGEAAFFAPAYRCVEVDQSWFAHGRRVYSQQRWLLNAISSDFRNNWTQPASWLAAILSSTHANGMVISC